MKICTKCGAEKPEEDFPKGYKTKNGLGPWCKACMREKSRKWRMNNKELLSKQRKKYKGNRKESDRRYRESHKEQIAKQNKIYRKTHKEERNQASKLYRKTHKGKIAESSRRWRKENQDKIKIYTQRRIAKKRQLLNTLTTAQWEAIKQHFNYTCAYCGKRERLTVDHFIPVSKSGELTTNNVLPSCASCNCSKGARLFNDWYPEQPFYSKKREKSILKFLNYRNETQQLALYTITN